MTRSWPATLLIGAVLLGSHASAQDSLSKPLPGAALDPAAEDGGSRPTEDAAPAAQAIPSDKTKTAKKKSKPPKHPSLTIGKVVTLDLTTRVESDIRMATPVIGRNHAELEWQDRRLGVKGTAFKRIEFELSRELGGGLDTSRDLNEKTAWRDAYVNTQIGKSFSLEAGRFKLPFGREELTAEANLDFVHRSLAADVLSPGRDPGVMAQGRAAGRKLEYQLGYFTRDGDNARTPQTTGGRGTLAARAVWKPLPSTTAPLEIGVAIAETRLEDRLGLRGETVLGDGVFFDRMYVNGRRQRIGLEAAWEQGPVALSGEYIRIADGRTGMGFDGEDLPSVSARAWYASGTWAITGERKHGRLEPLHDLFRGGIGAIEAAARVERLRFDTAPSDTVPFGFPAESKLLGNSDLATTIGLNWYLNHYMKIQANIVMESIADPDRSPAPTAGGRLTSTVFRIQFRL